MGMAFLANVPLPWRSDMLSDFQQRLQTSVGDRTVRIDCNVFASYMDILSLQLQWQIGISAHWVAYDPPDTSTLKVVVLRSAFWRLAAGQLFAALLERIAAANFATHSTTFEWLGHYTSL